MNKSSKTYQPPYQITKEILALVSKIIDLMGRLQYKGVHLQKPILRRKNKIRSIHSSLAIENNQLSEAQVTLLIDGKKVIGPLKDILEVQNAIKVYERMEDLNPFSEQDLLQSHALLMQGLVGDAGHYRQGNMGVIKNEKVIFVAPPSEQVPQLMKQLFDYLQHSEDHFLIKGCVFHYEFEFIHPFSDGNGRMGRLWQTCLLAKEHSLFYGLPIESIVKASQSAYYEAIAASHRDGHSTRFITFMLTMIEKTIQWSLKEFNPSKALSSQAERLLTSMQNGRAYSLQELMEKLKLKSRASFKIHYLDPLRKAGLVEMTDPEKPNSRNQRYVKK